MGSSVSESSAIGMAGFFTIQLPNKVYALQTSHETLGGSFVFGIMTAILSTPCTAPLMGAAAAWATTQSPATVLTVFGAIGIGMAIPYLILSAFPDLVKKMPRTGPASEVVKQVMGLLLLAAVGRGLLFNVRRRPIMVATRRQTFAEAGEASTTAPASSPLQRDRSAEIRF